MAGAFDIVLSRRKNVLFGLVKEKERQDKIKIFLSTSVQHLASAGCFLRFTFFHNHLKSLTVFKWTMQFLSGSILI